MTRTKRQSGFTLIEVLIAAVITTGLLAVVYATWFGTVRSVERCATITDSGKSARKLLTAMTRQIRTSYPDWNKTDKDATNDQDESIIIKLVTTSGIGHDPKFPNGPFEVEYKFDSQKATVFYRQRSHMPGASSWSNDNRWIALADKIGAIELSYYDGQKWLTSWDSEKTKDARIPHAVKINIMPAKSDEALATTVFVSCHDRARKPKNT